MAKFNILLTIVIFTASLIVSHAMERLPEWFDTPPKDYNGNEAKRLPEWPGIPPKGYNGQKAKRLPEWPGIPPKGYNGPLTSEGIAPSASANDAEAPYGDGAWLKASSPKSAPKANDDEKAKRLPEWPGIPPNGYNGQKAKRLPEWPGIPPKSYNGYLTTEGIALSASANNVDAPYEDGVSLEASFPRSALPSQ